MEEKNGKDRSSKFSEKPENSQFALRVGGVGTIPGCSTEHESYEIGTSRENCEERNSIVTGEQPLNTISGKFLRQLVNETEKQLAHHEQQSQYHDRQAELLQKKLEELQQLAESLTDIARIE